MTKKKGYGTAMRGSFAALRMTAENQQETVQLHRIALAVRADWKTVGRREIQPTLWW